MDWTEYLVELTVLLLTFAVHTALTLRSLVSEKAPAAVSSNILRIRVTERHPRF